MTRDLKENASRITKSGLNITELLERAKKICGNGSGGILKWARRTEDIAWYLNLVTSGQTAKGNYSHVPVKIMQRCLKMYMDQGFVNGNVELTERLASVYHDGVGGRKHHLDYIMDILDPDCKTTGYHSGLAEHTIIGKMFAKDSPEIAVNVEKLIEDFDILFDRYDETAIREVMIRWRRNLVNGCDR